MEDVPSLITMVCEPVRQLFMPFSNSNSALTRPFALSWPAGEAAAAPLMAEVDADAANAGLLGLRIAA